MKTQMRNRRRVVPLVVLPLIGLVLGASLAHAEQYQFVTKWGSRGGGDGQFSSAIAVAVDTAGNVCVSDHQNNRMQKFTSNGVFLTKWGSYGSGDGQFTTSRGVGIDAAGNVYMADCYNHRVQKFTSSGVFLTKWGSLGSGDGQFQYPIDVAVDDAGNVYVAEQGGCRIQKFTSEGVFLTKWGSYGTDDGQFGFPAGMAIDAFGNVYVTDVPNDRIQKFTSEGVFLTKWGSSGSGDGQFNDAYGVAIDAAANVYVADTSNHRIQKFTSEGAFLTKWGSLGSGDEQFNNPYGLVVDVAGNVYVCDLLNYRVQKFRPANGVPTANAGPDQTVEASKAAGADVTLDGSASSDPDGNPLTYAWTWSDAEGDHAATGVNPTVSLPMGETTVTLRVNDGRVASAPDTILIAVEDTTPPQISDLKVTPALLWPANNKLCAVTLSYTVTDAVDPSPQVAITSVTCNEASFSAADYTITDATQLKLRAKREGTSKAGRIYTITLTATDAAGRASEKQCTVCVPHDMSGKGNLIATATAMATTGGAQIVFGLTADAKVTVRVLNLAGRPVRMLCADRLCQAGSSTVLWNAASSSGLSVPNGTYLIEVDAVATDGARIRAVTRVRVDR